MPAYSFQQRFVPMVKEGTKKQTIRTFRKSPPRIGQKAHLYTGMRTKNCQKLIKDSPDIKDVKCVWITVSGELILMDTNWLTEDDIVNLNSRVFPKGVQVRKLGSAEKDVFAWNDGFRHQDRPLSTDGCFEIMFRWFAQTAQEGFIGNVIYW